MNPLTQQSPRQAEAGQAAPAAPSPVLFFETIRAFQQSVALKAAVDAGLFTAIAEGADTTSARERW